jgi:hypothetical protein
MRILSTTLSGATALALILTACGDDGNKAAPPIDSGSGSGTDTTPPAATFHQVEQLARPAINEALLITTAYLDGYNATAPTFAGVPPDTLPAVVGEAKTVLKALYLGGCLLDGLIPGVTATNGVHPAGMTCVATGTALFLADGVTLTTTAATAAQTYADKVFAQFIPDVLRIDTAGPSNYLTLCGGTGPLLCGGRGLADDVVDITYNYLLNGADNYLNPAQNTTALGKQLIALTSDGVVYSKTAAKNVDSLSAPDPTNAQQGHPDFLATFPYSAPPF